MWHVQGSLYDRARGAGIQAIRECCHRGMLKREVSNLGGASDDEDSQEADTPSAIIVTGKDGTRGDWLAPNSEGLLKKTARVCCKKIARVCSCAPWLSDGNSAGSEMEGAAYTQHGPLVG